VASVAEVVPGQLLAGRWRVAGVAGAVPGGSLVNALDERLRRRVRVLVTTSPEPARAGLVHPLLPVPLATESDGARTFVAWPFWDGDQLGLPTRPLGDTREVHTFVARAIVVLELLDLVHQTTGRAHGHLSLSSFWRCADGRWWMVDAAVLGAPDPRFAYPDDDPTDPRSDLYAFAAVLHAVATGSLPFGTGDGAPIAHRVLRPPATEALPAPIVEVLRTALQKAPHHRFASAGRMIAALQQALAAVDGDAFDPRDAPERVPVGWRMGSPEPTLEPAPPRNAGRALQDRRRERAPWSVLALSSLAFLSLFAWLGLAGLCLALGRVF
jgi:hypothetical protein